MHSSQASPQLEVLLARRLLAHAALCPGGRDTCLVAGALRLAAARLGYGGVSAHLGAFMKVGGWRIRCLSSTFACGVVQPAWD